LFCFASFVFAALKVEHERLRRLRDKSAALREQIAADRVHRALKLGHAETRNVSQQGCDEALFRGHEQCGETNTTPKAREGFVADVLNA
jgi:hypothetical protein